MIATGRKWLNECKKSGLKILKKCYKIHKNIHNVDSKIKKYNIFFRINKNVYITNKILSK